LDADEDRKNRKPFSSLSNTEGHEMMMGDSSKDNSAFPVALYTRREEKRHAKTNKYVLLWVTSGTHCTPLHFQNCFSMKILPQLQ
jgi:hypothetical protein